MTCDRPADDTDSGSLAFFVLYSLYEVIREGSVHWVPMRLFLIEHLRKLFGTCICAGIKTDPRYFCPTVLGGFEKPAGEKVKPKRRQYV